MPVRKIELICEIGKVKSMQRFKNGVVVKPVQIAVQEPSTFVLEIVQLDLVCFKVNSIVCL